MRTQLFLAASASLLIGGLQLDRVRRHRQQDLGRLDDEARRQVVRLGGRDPARLRRRRGRHQRNACRARRRRRQLLRARVQREGLGQLQEQLARARRPGHHDARHAADPARQPQERRGSRWSPRATAARSSSRPGSTRSWCASCSSPPPRWAMAPASAPRRTPPRTSSPRRSPAAIRTRGPRRWSRSAMS